MQRNHQGFDWPVEGRARFQSCRCRCYGACSSRRSVCRTVAPASRRDAPAAPRSGRKPPAPFAVRLARQRDSAGNPRDARRQRGPGLDQARERYQGAPCAATCRLFRSGFWPLDGSEELFGVMSGRSSSANRTSSAAMRTSATSNCPTTGSKERISASFSAWLSLLRSVSDIMPTLAQPPMTAPTVSPNLPAATNTPNQQLPRQAITPGTLMKPRYWMAEPIEPFQLKNYLRVSSETKEDHYVPKRV